ncbi:linalool dehydratase/isomerase domain-containing protein [Nocardia sp. R7R-8]|uniref:linalool dehydratase/isomerase domain-containing protein n=1 Tax=Nocardia sp. R7R-8 TaxID=3459304 RepID=UPI00403E28E9
MTSSKLEPNSVQAEGAAAADAVLTAQQLGHLRHFDNLSRQLPNDWSLMLGKATGQDDFGGYRFQLAYMAYALALTHVHRLPNAPGVFKPVFERIMDKILLPEVWLYWRDSSRGGNVFNAHLMDRLHEAWDPVARDNIMYSAYVQSLSLMYHYLFGDDRYAQPGALTFEHWSFFWGGEPKRFEYDENSLNEQVYWQMVESGYLGVACEPNCVFQICNQPAILGFRMHDLVYGGNVAAEVTRSYERAWSQLGRLDSTGRYNMLFTQDTRTVVPNELSAPWVDAWCGAMMNMWNRDFVRAHYPEQVAKLLVDGPDGTKSVGFAPDMEVMGRKVVNDTCDFGWVAAWASEMGDSATLDGLLAHADRYMNPTWRNGGLYYPRNDVRSDENGNRTEVEPLTGNTLLGYARLNVPDGLWKLYNEPWHAAHFTEPALTVVADDIEVSRARFASDSSTLTFRIQRHDDRNGDGSIILGNVVDRAHWSLREDGVVLATGRSGEPVQAGRLADGGRDIDLEHVAEGLALRVPVGAPRTFELEVSPAERAQR